MEGVIIMKHQFRKFLSLLVAVILAFGASIGSPISVKADVASVDVASADVTSVDVASVDVASVDEASVDVASVDEASASFPNIYPADKIIKMSDGEVKLRVDALIASMTEDELYSMLRFGSSGENSRGYGTGFVKGVPRLGVPVIRMWDGPKGVISNSTLETSSPSSELALASSFSPELSYKYGQLTGRDNKATAGNVQLGVQLDITRTPLFMRSRDSLGEDPYLSGVLGSQLSAGVESENVISTLKHLSAYTGMFHHPILVGMGAYIPGLVISQNQDNSIVDDQTLHEIYLAPYKRIIEDGNSSGVMSSFNKINGVPAAVNTYLLKDILRDMWGFKGAVMTDWGAGYDVLTYDNVPGSSSGDPKGGGVSVHRGNDIETNSNYNTKANIATLVDNGGLTQEEAGASVENAVRNTLTAMGRVGYLGLVVVGNDGKAVADPNPPASIEIPELTGADRAALMEADDVIALESAIIGAVLLKNDDNALPLKPADDVAVIGITGHYTLTGHYAESSFGWLQSMASPYENLVDILGASKLESAIGNDIEGKKIPDEYLFVENPIEDDPASSSMALVDALTDANGVTLAITGGETKIISNVELTTGTIGGKVNRTFKNSADGTALTNGTAATITTYLAPPDTGRYGLKLSGIGANVTNAIITVAEGTDIRLSGGTSGGTGFQDANAGWPTGNLVCTAEGMNISGAFAYADLEAGHAYKITVAATANSAAKDMQLRLTWLPPGQAEANKQAAIKAAEDNSKVVVFVHDLANGDKPGAVMTTFHRSTLDLDAGQLELLNSVIGAAKAKGNQVIVVTNIGSPITMDWVDSVDAVLNMWLPGQAGGKATAQLLTGAANPSGKLPITFPKDKNDTELGLISELYKGSAEDMEKAWNNLKEGIFCGYRWYDKQGIQPLFAFGHGLSYTSFVYSDLAVTETAGTECGFDVKFNVKNSGSVAGSEVAQLYLGKAANVPSGIQMAEKQLAGFKRIEDLAPGETREVTIKIDRQSLSYWDKDKPLITRADGTKDKYIVAAGLRDILVGPASDDIRLTKNVNVNVIDEPITTLEAPALVIENQSGSTMRRINVHHPEITPENNTARRIAVRYTRDGSEPTLTTGTNVSIQFSGGMSYALISPVRAGESYTVALFLDGERSEIAKTTIAPLPPILPESGIYRSEDFGSTVAIEPNTNVLVDVNGNVNIYEPSAATDFNLYYEYAAVTVSAADRVDMLNGTYDPPGSRIQRRPARSIRPH